MEQKTKDLERILHEFYNLPNDDSKRRSDMDIFLNNYKAQPDSYEHVRYYLTNSNNQFVHWFSLLIMEYKVCKSWNSLPQNDQNEVKTYLFELFLNKTQTPNYIITKIGQILADIGRNDFNEQNSHEYISNIIKLVINPNTSLRGINLLQYISNEFLTNKHIATQEKKNQLQSLLLKQVPLIISTLTQSLSNLFAQNAEKKLPFKTTNLIANFSVGSPDTNTYTCSFSSESKQLTNAIFDTLLCYFQWIPLNGLLTPNLLDVLFKYLRLENNSIPALSCLNEILSKNYVPKEFEEFLMRIFHQIFSLLTDIASNSNLYSRDFLDKFTQFISLFVSNHLRRVENNPNFPISDFLSLLFQYSFLQTTFESFLQCIEIWSKFLDYLIQIQQSTTPPPSLSKYTDGLILFQSELVKRTLYTFSKKVLSNIDDSEEELDENNNSETELDKYIKSCIEIVVKITELYPTKSLENLYPLFTEFVTNFFAKAEESIKQGLLTVDQHNDEDHQIVKDNTTILYLFSRLSNQFVASFVQTFAGANFIFQKLLDMCSFSISNSTFRFGGDWEKLLIQILDTIRSFSYWLLEYGNQVRTVPNQQPDYDNTITKLINIITPLFQCTVAEGISIASGRLLMSLVCVSKPLNLLQMMDNLIGNIHSIVQPLSQQVQTIVYSAISATILNPPSNVNLSHQWDVRRPKYSIFIKGITVSYLEIQQIPMFLENKVYEKPEVIQRVQRVLRILKAIVKSVPDLTQAKSILHDAIQDTLHVTLGLFRIYVKFPEVLDPILDFFFTLFESLKVSVVFQQQTLATFLEVLGGDQLSQLLQQSNSSSTKSTDVGNRIVTKLLEILIFVNQTPTSTSEGILTSTIDFTMDKIYPAISNTTSPILPIFYQLLYCILDNQWKQCKPHQIERILLSFQDNFQKNSDVNLFKLNLDNFAKLNNKIKLYEKIAAMEPVFGCTFIQMFIDVLISESQAIHIDEIIDNVYRFASINFDKFFNVFLNSYLVQKQITFDQKQHLLSHFTQDKDQPTFNRNLNQFINDFCYYSYLNSTN